MGNKLRLSELKVGDKIVMPHYDDEPATVTDVDYDDAEQPVSVKWEDGTFTWPEQRFVCENTVKL